MPIIKYQEVKEDIQICTKVALTLIGVTVIGPVVLLALIIRYGAVSIKNYYYPPNIEQTLQDKEDDDERLSSSNCSDDDVTTIGDEAKPTD
jgi:hypothetical protein